MEDLKQTKMQELKQKKNEFMREYMWQKYQTEESYRKRIQEYNKKRYVRTTVDCDNCGGRHKIGKECDTSRDYREAKQSKYKNKRKTKDCPDCKTRRPLDEVECNTCKLKKNNGCKL
jgi:hypothetical protein